ncbi:hypothetical protein CRYUN_Cryun23aG0136800 [Craigia yunnanensis]
MLINNVGFDHITLKALLRASAELNDVDFEEAFEVFDLMKKEGVKGDGYAFCSLLNSCGSWGFYELGRQLEMLSWNTMIVVYGQHGDVEKAMEPAKPDLVTWASILGAYSFHCLSKENIIVFEEMLATGVKPDQIAFLGILSTCSHGGLVNEGLHYFYIMMNDYRIVPDSEHHTCLVDLLGRAGLVDEAFNVLASHPIACTPDTLGAFIGACNIHGNITLAKWAAEKLVVLEPNKPVNYTLISNMYASKGRWLDVASVRKMMMDHCDYKIPGCSWMETAGDVNVFASSDKSHSKTLDM